MDRSRSWRFASEQIISQVSATHYQAFLQKQILFSSPKSTVAAPSNRALHDDEVLSPFTVGPFRFVALPFDIRKLVYEFVFVSEHEVSLDKGSNLYYRIGRPGNKTAYSSNSISGFLGCW